MSFEKGRSLFNDVLNRGSCNVKPRLPSSGQLQDTKPEGMTKCHATTTLEQKKQQLRTSSTSTNFTNVTKTLQTMWCNAVLHKSSGKLGVQHTRKRGRRGLVGAQRVRVHPDRIEDNNNQVLVRHAQFQRPHPEMSALLSQRGDSTRINSCNVFGSN